MEGEQIKRGGKTRLKVDERTWRRSQEWKVELRDGKYSSKEWKLTGGFPADQMIEGYGLSG